MERELTCIVCPMGCHITVTLEEGKVLSVTGNTCPRGKVYAENECTHPKRTITSTVLKKDGTPVAVKTDKPIPKEKMMDCMNLLKTVSLDHPVHIGDVLLKDVFGANIVVTENSEA